MTDDMDGQIVVSGAGSRQNLGEVRKTNLTCISLHFIKGKLLSH